MKRIALVSLIVILLLIPTIGVNCDSNGNADEDNNVDTTPPVISGITVSDVTENTATISWITDESATSHIDYGLTTSYGFFVLSTVDTTADKTNHRLELSGLSPDTTYHFKVKSKDESGNEAISNDITFATASSNVDENTTADTASPVITGITVIDITTSSATIAWTTNEPATSQTEYGETDNYSSNTTEDADLVTTHSVTLTGLNSATEYHFSVKSKDESGNEAISVDNNFTTSSILLPVATLSGQPTGTVKNSTADITVAGNDVVSYKYKLDSGTWSAETPVSSHIILSGLAGSLHTISVIGKDTTGNWQSEASPTTSSWTVDAIVTFPDDNLEAVIRTYISKPTGDIYQSDLVGLTSVFSVNDNIADLTGLEHCISLSNLELAISQISDLSPLTTLTSLTELRLYSNQKSDLSPLSTLTNLTYLNLSDNQISDISPLSSLTHLTILHLGLNQISDLSSLSSLTNLTTLALGYNQINDLSPLSPLTSLKWLYLDDNQITDIKALVSNQGLGLGDQIDLKNNPLNDTSLNTYIPELEGRGVTVAYTPPSKA